MLENDERDTSTEEYINTLAKHTLKPYSSLGKNAPTIQWPTIVATQSPTLPLNQPYIKFLPGVSHL